MLFSLRLHSNFVLVLYLITYKNETLKVEEEDLLQSVLQEHLMVKDYNRCLESTLVNFNLLEILHTPRTFFPYFPMFTSHY
jgi:hypothetical protein